MQSVYLKFYVTEKQLEALRPHQLKLFYVRYAVEAGIL